jgi:hypothetical protein
MNNKLIERYKKEDNMKNFNQKRFLLRVIILTLVFVVFITIPYAIGKLVIDPIADSPLYPGGPTFPLVSLPVVHVTVPNEFTSGTTISSSQMNANFKAVGNQMPGVEWATISQSNINVRFATKSGATLATVTVSAPCDGYVVVRFDGSASADAGDELILAASDTPTWNTNDGAVSFFSDNKNYEHPFSHTRVYSVASGLHTFYAVAQNWVYTAGDGRAYIYGTLTATFYPNRY